MEQSTDPTRKRSMMGSERAVLRSIRETVRSLDIAARSILDNQAALGTVADVIAERALDHHWEGLFQYAAIRVGAAEASQLLEQLAREVQDAPLASEDVAGPTDGADAAAEAVSSQPPKVGPSPQASLYARMRSLIGPEHIHAHSAEPIAWWSPEDARWRRGLQELRRTLTPQQSEIAELRFARRLTAADVAQVTGSSVPQVEVVSGECLKVTEERVGKRPDSRDRTPEGALLEAFTLDARRMRAPRRQGRRPVLPLGTVIGSRYEVEGLLGTGAFADVYRARDRDVTDHVVALKLLRSQAKDEQSVHAALRELQLIASVFHPSVVQLKDHGWHNGRLWFVMPLYRGETLTQRVKRGALSRREAREIFEPLAEALATMHRAGVLHQDIKPDNVFLANLDPDDNSPAPPRILPVLLDLGVAAKDAELVLAGTPAYFAPEVAARFAGAPDPAPVGPKSDIFSLTLTLRSALDPEAVDDLSAAAVDAFVQRRATGSPRPPTRRDLSDLREFFEAGMAFSPDARPSAEEFRQRLAELTLPEERRARHLATMRWALPTAIALLALFGSVVFVLSREAEIQRSQATAARERAENVFKDLTAQQARQRELEADIAQLEREYQSSKLTREQLASRLAETEAKLEVLTEQLQVVNREKDEQAATLKQQAEELHALHEEQGRVQLELKATRQRRDELGTKLDRTTEQLGSERAKREELEAQATRLREDLRTTHSDLESERKHQSELEARLTILRRLLGPNADKAPEAGQAQPLPKPPQAGSGN